MKRGYGSITMVICYTGLFNELSPTITNNRSSGLFRRTPKTLITTTAIYFAREVGVVGISVQSQFRSRFGLGYLGLRKLEPKSIQINLVWFILVWFDFSSVLFVFSSVLVRFGSV